MKTIINTLFATIAISLTASASPALLVEATITKHQVNGERDVSTILTVESGLSSIEQWASRNPM